jgi:hypothetical protein
MAAPPHRRPEADPDSSSGFKAKMTQGGYARGTLIERLTLFRQWGRTHDAKEGQRLSDGRNRLAVREQALAFLNEQGRTLDVEAHDAGW